MSLTSKWVGLLLAVLVLGPVATTALVAPADAAAARRLGDRPLRPGARGADVKELQRLLVAAGVPVSVDGAFGAATTSAVQRFQRAANLEASGVVGVRTVAALRQATAGRAAEAGPVGGLGSDGTGARARSLGDRIPVRQGMSGHDVKVLQDLLRRSGVDDVTVDGEFGSGTARAVRTFERGQKLPADGAMDANDIDVLRGLVSAGGRDAPSAPAPMQLAPGDRARLGPDGLATAPASAPESVKQMIAAGNKIAKTPYVWGGGHGRWEDKGYDCSGSMSYVLHAAGVLDSPLVSGDFPSWGDPGPGRWVTAYGNKGHGYLVIAGLRYDTSGAKQDGSRWHATLRPTKGYGVSHPPGL